MSDREPASNVSRTLISVVALLLVVGSLAAGETAAPEAWVSLESRFEKAKTAGDYSAALQVAEEMWEFAAPMHLEALYQYAAVNCLMGNEEGAFVALQRTLDAGWWDFRRLLGDEDFAAIKGQDRFRKMVRSAWAGQYIAMLERPEREDFQKPDLVMKALALRPGERVADIGTGSGYFTVRVARQVAPGGKVWAMDIRQEMLDHVAARLEQESIGNVELRLVEKDDPKLPPGEIDTILMVDTIHYVQDRAAYAAKLRRGLAPGGRLVIIDYTPKPFEERPWGPPPEQQIPRETLDAELAEAGFLPIRSHDFLPEQYFVEYGIEAGEARE